MSITRTLSRVALPAFPLALLVGSLVSPTDSDDNAPQLAAAAAHHGAWAATTVIEFLAAILLALAVFGAVPAIRGRGAGLAAGAWVLGALGTVGMAAIALRHMFVDGLSALPAPAALGVLDRVDGAYGLLVLPAMIAAPFALVALGFAALRAGIAPWWIAVGTVVFAVVDDLPIPEAELVQGVVGIVVLGALALGLRGGRADGVVSDRDTLDTAPFLSVP